MTGRPSFTCPDCGRTSWNPNDVKYGYCGACHAFTFTESARTVVTFCPYCRAQFDAVTGLTGDRRPAAGDAGICAYCAGLLVYDDAGGVHEPDVDQLREMLADARLMTARDAMQRVIRDRRRA